MDSQAEKQRPVLKKLRKVGIPPQNLNKKQRPMLENYTVIGR